MAGGWTRENIARMILSDVDNLNSERDEISKFIDESTSGALEIIDALFAQIRESSSRPLITKTPKVVRKKINKRIETIPEDDIVNIENTTAKTLQRKQSESTDEDEPIDARRKSKREASKKAGDSIKQLQSTTLNSKMRRPSEDNNPRSSKASSRDSQMKRLRSVRSSDEDESKQPKKQIKKEPRSVTPAMQNKEEEDISTEDEVFETLLKQFSTTKGKPQSTNSRTSKRLRSPQSEEPDSKKANIIDETIDGLSPDDTIEPSMYEDAIGKAVPIMHSTMKPTSLGNLTRTINPTDAPANNSNKNEPLTRMMNVTVVLENVVKVNETVTISSGRSNAGTSSNGSKEKNDSPFLAPSSIPKVTLHKMKPVVERDPLITDDDSSPERKLPKDKKMHKKSIEKAKYMEDVPRRITRSSLMSEDEVDLTPGRKILGEINREKGQELKSKLKKNIIFSPYGKESVKRKIEAFEQAGLSNPVVEVNSGMRLTRTKTRALAAAGENEPSTSGNSITQKLARKSLAKAKQISRAKDAKDTDDTKENPTKLPVNDKLVQKQQLRTTPNSKNRPQMPTSVNRGFTTPSNTQSLASYSKAMTGSRPNIVTNMDTFIQSKNSAQKPNSNDKLMEERKRKLQEEDTKKKRDENLKAQVEEKKRKREEKEQKNRLAREAKEKLEAERRLLLEQKELDKERKMMQLQEHQRIENEKKRLAYLKRLQEKEERRKQEEELRLQRLRDQEETERLLAEQKRRELEMEKRRMAELKAQQAAAESAKARVQMMAAQAKKQGQLQAQNKQAANCYKIDSEPDSDSDDELRPKHNIPEWAKTANRLEHLKMQEHIPMEAMKQFFDAKKCTPDLSELFQGIDKNRLKRTSSAIWKTPPRFSRMDEFN